MAVAIYKIKPANQPVLANENGTVRIPAPKIVLIKLKDAELMVACPSG